MAERLGARQESPAGPSNTPRNKPTTEGTFGRSRGRPGQQSPWGAAWGRATGRGSMPRPDRVMARRVPAAEGVGFEPTVPYETHALQARVDVAARRAADGGGRGI